MTPKVLLSISLYIYEIYNIMYHELYIIHIYIMNFYIWFWLLPIYKNCILIYNSYILIIEFIYVYVYMSVCMYVCI